jgi:hypothetical protein
VPLVAHAGADLTDHRIDLRMAGEALEVRRDAPGDARAGRPVVGGHEIERRAEDDLGAALLRIELGGGA